jgi:broad-specificity NMP kinase
MLAPTFADVAIVLVTGMSGTGKSTVLAELARRGHAVVDTDYGNYIQAALLPDQAEAEPLWHEERMHALLDTHTGGHLFIAGTVANQGSFYPRFDAVILLSAPVDVLLQRIESRTTNDFGKNSAERDRIVRDITAVEPLLRRRATLEIDTRTPVQDVVEAILAVGNSVRWRRAPHGRTARERRNEWGREAPRPPSLICV